MPVPISTRSVLAARYPIWLIASKRVRLGDPHDVEPGRFEIAHAPDVGVEVARVVDHHRQLHGAGRYVSRRSSRRSRCEIRSPAGTTCAIADRLVACGRAPTPQSLSARGQRAFRARVDRVTVATTIVATVAGSTVVDGPATVAAAPIESSSAQEPTSAYASSGSFRLADTRSTDCGCTLLDATTMRVDVAGRFGIADDITAAVVTVTATNITADSFLTAYPAGQAVPNTSIVNPRRNHDVGNTAIVPVGVGGAIDIRSTIAIGSAIDVVVDVTGFFVPADVGDARPIRAGHTRTDPRHSTTGIADRSAGTRRQRGACPDPPACPTTPSGSS